MKSRATGSTILGVFAVLLVVLIASAARSAGPDLWVYGLAVLLLIALAAAVLRFGRRIRYEVGPSRRHGPNGISVFE